MTEFTAVRNGITHGFVISDPLPYELEGYPFPKDVQQAVTAGEAAWTAAAEAETAWQDAVVELEAGGPTRDKDLLIAAIRAGKPDPGTPHTSAARRAEEVAWVAFEVARNDAKEPMLTASRAVAQYLRDHGDQIAQRELDLIAEAENAAQLAHAAAVRATEARFQVGLAYVHLRWFAGDRLQPEPFRLAPNGNDPAYDLQVRDKYLVMTGQPAEHEVKLTGKLAKF